MHVVKLFALGAKKQNDLSWNEKYGQLRICWALVFFITFVFNSHLRAPHILLIPFSPSRP